MRPRFEPDKLAIGAGLVALGTVGLLSRIGWLDFLTTVHTWWPAILVVWGFAELYATFAERETRRLP
jgi:hypothetical protein